MVATVLAGLGGRAVLPDAVAGPYGDALYAAMLVWLVVLVAPRTRPVTAAAVALGLSTAVEVSHLTGLPAVVLDRFPAARYVLGTTFGVADLLWYATGAALAGALLAVLGPRPAVVGRYLQHVRERRPARWVPAVVVPLALLALVGAAGLGVARTLQDESDLLADRITSAQAELADGEGKVADDAALSTLARTIGDAVTTQQGTPVLERRPGDALDAAERLDHVVAVVHDSRRVLATAQATEARSSLDAPQRRAAGIIAATDELADEGRAADDTARTALRDAVAASEALESSTGPEALATMDLDELEAVAPALAAGRDAVDGSTTALMVAQDAAACPEEDQRWDPAGGKIDEDDLAPIPWAPQHQVRADLVDGLVALDDAYRAEFGTHLTVNSGYRSYSDQLAVFNPANPNPLAAPPGCSNHGLGTAVDVSMGPEGFDGARFAWMTAHAAEFGWTHPDWAGPTGRLPEPWHWESVETPQGY